MLRIGTGPGEVAETLYVEGEAGHFVYATRFIGLVSGPITELRITLDPERESDVTAIDLGVFMDSGTGESPGGAGPLALGSKEGGPFAPGSVVSVPLTVTTFLGEPSPLHIEAGTAYWLVVSGRGGENIRVLGTEFSKENHSVYTRGGIKSEKEAQEIAEWLGPIGSEERGAPLLPIEGLGTATKEEEEVEKEEEERQEREYKEEQEEIKKDAEEREEKEREEKEAEEEGVRLFWIPGPEGFISRADPEGEVEPELEGEGGARAEGTGEIEKAEELEGEGGSGGEGTGFPPHEEPKPPEEIEELWRKGASSGKIPQYVGAFQPRQVVKIRLGRFSHYYQDNHNHAESHAHEGLTPMGCGHQPWDESNFPCRARVGLHGGGPKTNKYYSAPWQAKWIGSTPFVEIPNVFEVKLDKKLEGQLGAVGTAVVEIENILYPTLPEAAGPLAEELPGAPHGRERGGMAPLRGLLAEGNAYAPAASELVGVAEWLAELAEAAEGFTPNEWEGRFFHQAQIVVYQGYGDALVKTFTGLIEGSDSTSRPDRITLSCRDFGQAFTDTHFFGWGMDPIIRGPVVFTDKFNAGSRSDVGKDAHASTEVTGHEAKEVLDFKYDTWWQSAAHTEPGVTEYVEVGLKEGIYRFADIRTKWPNMELFLAIHPAPLPGGKPSTITRPGHLAEGMTPESGWIDKNGWVDITKAETQIVPGAHGGNSYTVRYENYPEGDQTTPFHMEGEPAFFTLGDNSVIRISFRKLHKGSDGKYRAGVEEFHGLHEQTNGEAISKAEWVLTEDVADVIRILCQWAGFKEWDIPDTGVRLPKKIVAWQNESYMDVIKQICEGLGFMFFMADPVQDGPHEEGINSLGIPTFRKSRVITPDTETERELREGVGTEGGGGFETARGGEVRLPNRGSRRPGLPNPSISDRELLTAINLNQNNEVLSSLIRVVGLTLALPGDLKEGIDSGHHVMYTFRPPWAGNPDFHKEGEWEPYADGQLAGLLKAVFVKEVLFATASLCRNAAFFIALRQAIESIEATIEIPALPILDIDDHAVLMDSGTGVATRMAILERSSVFRGGENRLYTMTLTGTLIDTPNVRDMVNIINEVATPNGIVEEVGKRPREPTVSSLGYG